MKISDFYTPYFSESKLFVFKLGTHVVFGSSLLVEKFLPEKNKNNYKTTSSAQNRKL